jgi:hypothetical protein
MHASLFGTIFERTGPCSVTLAGIARVLLRGVGLNHRENKNGV